MLPPNGSANSSHFYFAFERPRTDKLIYKLTRSTATSTPPRPNTPGPDILRHASINHIECAHACSSVFLPGLTRSFPGLFVLFVGRWDASAHACQQYGYLSVHTRASARARKFSYRWARIKNVVCVCMYAGLCATALPLKVHPRVR